MAVIFFISMGSQSARTEPPTFGMKTNNASDLKLESSENYHVRELNAQS